MLPINYSKQMITATVEGEETNDKLVATVTYSGGDAEKEIRFTNAENTSDSTPPAEKPTTAQFKAKKYWRSMVRADRTLRKQMSLLSFSRIKMVRSLIPRQMGENGIFSSIQ